MLISSVSFFLQIKLLFRAREQVQSFVLFIFSVVCNLHVQHHVSFAASSTGKTDALAVCACTVYVHVCSTYSYFQPRRHRRLSYLIQPFVVLPFATCDNKVESGCSSKNRSLAAKQGFPQHLLTACFPFCSVSMKCLMR